ncbi:MAG: RNA polymerase sigma factor [Steroidobacteraceae bacterium]
MTTLDNPTPEPMDESTENAPSHAAAVKQLFDEHNRTLIGFLHARLHSEAEARDVAQEAYVRLLELDNPDAVGFLRAYLFRIAANLAVDRLRHRTVRDDPALQMELAELADERDPERIVIASEELAVVRTVVLTLPEKCRRAFLWHVFDGQSTSEIAARLGLTDRMIRMYIAQTLAACRTELDARGTKDGRVSR